jgi:hypothetical protein
VLKSASQDVEAFRKQRKEKNGSTQ